MVDSGLLSKHPLAFGLSIPRIGDNGSAKDLGGAKKVQGKDGNDVYEVEIPTAREDVDSVWAASRSALRTKPAEVKESRDAATKQADRDRNSRTNTVLSWIGSNM